MDTIKYWKQSVSTAELLELLEENEDVAPDCIYITPPDNQGWQNSCRLMMRLIDEINEDEDEEDKESKDKQGERKMMKNSKLIKKRHWTKGELQKSPESQTNVKRFPTIILSEDSEPLEFLELFLSSEVLETLVKNTVMYAVSKNCKLEVGNDEMLVFISILYISRCVPVPRRPMFWEGRSDTKNSLVSNSLRRNWFEDIFRYIHAADNNNLPKDDKMAKLRPLIEKVYTSL
ncbi:hypothetical protein ILUMI_22595 [Ignelater luminosus]|uniref:PiggyBac transposable element-derived protein domain-containing protein n=1 Tax=Ignelater luminosus TaxID=2038154 RepID=A0A8K0CE29_IGNLU|nr:hypothetical protein ILUMI_22595 [Ignelater luminosus]